MSGWRPAGVDWVRLGLGGGSLLFGAWGALAPRSLGRLLRLDPVSARIIGFRDLGSAWLILALGGPLAYATRAVFDFGDAVTMARRNPLLAAGAALSSAVGATKAVRAGR